MGERVFQTPETPHKNSQLPQLRRNRSTGDLHISYFCTKHARALVVNLNALRRILCHVHSPHPRRALLRRNAGGVEPVCVVKAAHNYPAARGGAHDIHIDMSSFRLDEVAYRLVSSKWFDRVIIATIVVNCCFLALNDPTKPSTEQASFPPLQQHRVDTWYVHRHDRLG